MNESLMLIILFRNYFTQFTHFSGSNIFCHIQQTSPHYPLAACPKRGLCRQPRLHKWQQKQTAANRSTKHNKLFQPITDKKGLGVGFWGSVQMRRREALS